jgi:phytoene dehydrogenase-like protein
MSKVVVIGAGVGGMSAAARIAKAGHQVEIFEAANFVGGKCRTEWIGRYAFDTGPSLLTLPAVYRDFFLKTGSIMEEVLTQIPVDPAIVGNHQDKPHRSLYYIVYWEEPLSDALRVGSITIILKYQNDIFLVSVLVKAYT